MFWLPIRTLSQTHNLGATGEDRLLNCRLVYSKSRSCLTAFARRCYTDTPRGKRKFGTFEVDTRNASQPLVSFKLYVDGKEHWDLTVVGKPVVRAMSAPGSGLGRSLALNLRELLGLDFGRGWF